ncbi:membrane protein insertase YidC [Sneathiella chungangensis]|uniref:Membrane protein insertase YidC n=1 Tax=Sneathiella chungangensis TaxID=1418234 RepID=A0A845MI18_9PROT|nr:membrane protein insertase YidC [Sneathiella chungangensis]MZR23618.1 membrane protein insertase YidC [Sneathiella chungangensis]
MSDQKNLIIAIVLCFLIIFGFQYFVEGPQIEQAKQQEATTAASGTDTPSQIPGNADGASAPSAQGSMAQTGLTRAESLKKSERVRINTPALHGSVSLTGARLDDLTLIDYRETVNPTSPEIKLLSPVGSPHPYYAEFGWSPAPGANIKLPTAQTVWSTDSTELTPEKPLKLTWDNGEGLVFHRTISIDKHYMFAIEQMIENNTGGAVTLYPYGLISRHGTPETTNFYILHEGPIGVLNDTLEEIDYSDLEEGNNENFTSVGGWLGITDKFWLTALVPDQQTNIKARFSYAQQGARYQTDFLNQEGINVPAGETVGITNHLFAGAKVVSVLDEYEEEYNIDRFDLAIDWGWFYFLTKPIYFALEFLNSWIGNLGLAIMALTVIIKIILLPLAHKSYVSMSKMKRLQPEMLKLREKFGEDKQKLNQEMMALYKREKANPAAGCLPILLQIPIFFALYKVLFVTLLMRHQPFYGYIKDLAAPDPTTIFNLFGLIPWDPPQFLMIGFLPLLMGLSMFLQQRLNPQPADPVQAKIFLFMPIFFTYLLASFPAGLVIYWTWNNILSMAQQWLIMKRMGVSASGEKA